MDAEANAKALFDVFYENGISVDPTSVEGVGKLVARGFATVTQGYGYARAHLTPAALVCLLNQPEPTP